MGILEPLDNLLGLIYGLGQLDRFLYRILFPNLIDRSTFIMGSFNVDDLVVGLAINVV